MDEEGIFKHYKAKDRNEGKGNFIVEGSPEPEANLDEQLVRTALERLLDPVEVKRVADGTGPPDMEVGETIAVEVKGFEPRDEGTDSLNVEALVRGGMERKAQKLREAWRKHPERRGRRLRGYQECWIALSVPAMPLTLIRHSAYDDDTWSEHIVRETELWNEILTGCEKGSLREPRISRMAVLFHWSFPTAPVLVVHNTHAFSREDCAGFKGLPSNPGDTRIVEGVLEFGGITLTPNEGKIIWGTKPPGGRQAAATQWKEP